MNTEGIIQEVNSSFIEFFGYERQEIIQKPFTILFTLEDQLSGRPEEELEKVKKNGQANDNNYIVHKNKRTTWVSGESVLVDVSGKEPHILKLIQNIDVQKNHEISLAKLNEFNERILKSIYDPVVVIDRYGQIVKANESFRSLFQQGTDQTDFNSMKEIFRLNPLLEKLLTHSFQSGDNDLQDEMEILLPDGVKRMYSFSCRLLNLDEINPVYLVVMHDITMIRESEKQREDIIGFVAHELRNPLSNIVLCNDLLGETLKEGNMEEALEFLTRSQNNVMRLSKMIGELYDATKLESGHIRIDARMFNMNDMLKEAIDSIKELQPDYKIHVTGTAVYDVWGDRYRIMQVVTNYLANGIKYSDGSRDIDLMIKETEQDVIISVRDQGLGISREQQPFVFDRFFRAEKTKNFEGIGLGLYLCKKIVQSHKGRVWVESKEGKGSVFYFSIPLTKNESVP